MKSSHEIVVKINDGFFTFKGFNNSSGKFNKVYAENILKKR